MKLHISKDLALPLEAVTQTIAILAKRRAGKSYTMRRLIEQLFHARQQVVMVDPKGDQWGVRSAADGKAPGLPIVILGGERGDVPLESSSGEVVAKLVVEERVSVLLDLSLFRKHEVATFMTAFMENLYRLKAREIYRTPMMLVIDEADAIAPQKPQKGEERMLGAAEDIVRRGGQRGIGCVLVTQRSAVLNKNVLTQAQMLVALRTIAPQDLAAMNAWIDVHGTPAQRKTLMESLPSLPIGDAWFWSPGWPTADGIFKRTHVLPIETFDSGKSPEPGVKPVEPKNLADVDLDALKGQMAATIEKAKADDPKLLRAEIARLKREAGKPVAAATVPAKAAGPRREDLAKINALNKALEEAMKVIVKINAKEFFKAGGEALEQAEIEKAIKGAAQSVQKMVERHLDKRNLELDSLRREAQRVIGRLKGMLEADVQVNVDVRHNEPFTVSPTSTRPPKSPHRPSNGQGADVSRSQQRILNALAWMESVRIPVADKTQLALLADQSPTSGGYFNNLGALRTAGLIEYPAASKVALTDSGRGAATPTDVPTSSEELHEQLIRRLSGSQGAILRKLIDVYPRELAKVDLAEATNQSPTSGGYFNNLGRLRTLGLISYPSPGKVAALPVLFLE